MERAYIDQLNQAYDAFFADHQSRRSPVLVIDTNSLDYVHRSDDLKWTEDRIRQMLKLGSFQTTLPFDIPPQD